MPVMKVWNATANEWQEVGNGLAVPYQTSAPSNPVAGQLWVDSDDTTVNGLLVAEQIVSGSAVTSVTFSGLDGNAAGGYVLEGTLYNPTATNNNLWLSFNSNSASTDYYMQYILGNGSTISGGRVNGNGFFGALAGNSSSGVAQISLDPKQYIRALIQTSQHDGSALYCITRSITSIVTFTNITGITMTADVASSIGVGSTFRLYKRK